MGWDERGATYLAPITSLTLCTSKRLRQLSAVSQIPSRTRKCKKKLKGEICSFFIAGAILVFCFSPGWLGFSEGLLLRWRTLQRALWSWADCQHQSSDPGGLGGGGGIINESQSEAAPFSKSVNGRFWQIKAQRLGRKEKDLVWSCLQTDSLVILSKIHAQF